jgi:hypothetical protein
MLSTFTPQTILQPIKPWSAQEIETIFPTSQHQTILQKVKPWPVKEIENPASAGSPFAHLPLGARKIIEFAIEFGPCTYDHVGKRTGMTGIHAARTLKSAAANGYIKAVTRMVTTGNYVRANIYYSGVQ